MRLQKVKLLLAPLPQYDYPTTQGTLFANICYWSSLLINQVNSRPAMDNESKPDLLCRVCLRKQNALFAVANCSHRFCLQCSLAYIDSQANNFASTRCLEQGCREPLTKELPIYRQLSSQTLQKLHQFQAFQFLQKNHLYKSCKVVDCKGFFHIKQPKCQLCLTLHCPSCAEIAHHGKCAETREESEMRNLRYRRCPRCTVWIEKTEGCEFIHCKCGTEFCFKCGNEFSKDPCRMKELWESQGQMRAIMQELSLKWVGSPKQLALLLAKLLLFFLVSALAFTVTCLLLLLACALFTVLVALFVPFALCQPLSQIQSPGCRFLGNLLFVAAYPLAVAVVGLLMLLLILLYPLCRNCNHHGVYDPFNKALVKAALAYLQAAKYLLITDSQQDY